MTATEVSSCRITLVHAGTRRDVSVPEDVYLGEIADVVGAGAGLYLGRLAIVDRSGTVLDPRARVGDATDSGDALWLVDAEALLPVQHEPARESTGLLSADALATLQLCLLAVATVAALGTAYVTILLGAPASSTDPHRLRVTGGLGAVAVALALRPGATRAARATRWLSPVFGLAAGSTFPFVVPEGGVQLSVAAALLAAAAVAALARVSDPDDDGVTTPMFAALTTAALTCVLGVLLDWPGYVAGALLAGCGPLVLRALPSMSLEVPDGELIDSERFATTVWTARIGPTTSRRRRRARLRSATVEARVDRARRTMTTGALAIALASTIGLGGVLLADGDRSGLATWTAIAAGFLLVAAIGLQTRNLRDRAPKVILQVASGVLLLEAVAALQGQWSRTGDVLLLMGLLGLTTVALASAVAFSRGWQSVRLSRLADLLESISIVLILPCTLAAVDAVETFRQMTSG